MSAYYNIIILLFLPSSSYLFINERLLWFKRWRCIGTYNDRNCQSVDSRWQGKSSKWATLRAREQANSMSQCFGPDLLPIQPTHSSHSLLQVLAGNFQSRTTHFYQCFFEDNYYSKNSLCCLPDLRCRWFFTFVFGDCSKRRALDVWRLFGNRQGHRLEWRGSRIFVQTAIQVSQLLFFFLSDCKAIDKYWIIKK